MWKDILDPLKKYIAEPAVMVDQKVWVWVRSMKNVAGTLSETLSLSHIIFNTCAVGRYIARWQWTFMKVFEIHFTLRVSKYFKVQNTFTRSCLKIQNTFAQIKTLKYKIQKYLNTFLMYFKIFSCFLQNILPRLDNDAFFLHYRQ